MTMIRSCKVAVIGAGMAGLVAVRELLRESHDVTVFEKSNCVGGSWVYDPRTESDTVGVNPERQEVHGSLYASLRTNLPRAIMGFSDYSFTDRSFGDARQFPGHQEVLQFLEAFARDHRLMDVIKFGSEVVKVRRYDEESDRWMVKWKNGQDEHVEDFDAVVVCNGHYFEPNVPKISGIDRWPGKQVHSHSYRTPEPYENQVVVVVGMGPSGIDIAHDIAKLAKEVHVELKNPLLQIGTMPNVPENIFEHETITHVESDGQVHYSDGFSVNADVILYCTGYKYRFPFLETDDIVVEDDYNRVGPLYKHVFPPKHAPSLSFVGIPSVTIIFLTAEMQSKWIAHVLSGKCKLPSEKEMMASVKETYAELEKSGRPKRHTHWLHPKNKEYFDWLTAQIGCPPVESWRFEALEAVIKTGAPVFGISYRDMWKGNIPS